MWLQGRCVQHTHTETLPKATGRPTLVTSYCFSAGLLGFKSVFSVLVMCEFIDFSIPISDSYVERP